MQKSSLKDTLVHTYETVEDKVEKIVYDKWHIRLHKRAKKHIHSLRKRPDHHKDIISFTVATIVTILVFIAWYFISFPKIIDMYQVNKKESYINNSFSNPFNKLKDGLNSNNQNSLDFENNIQTE